MTLHRLRPRPRPCSQLVESRRIAQSAGAAFATTMISLPRSPPGTAQGVSEVEQDDGRCWIGPRGRPGGLVLPWYGVWCSRSVCTLRERRTVPCGLCW
jgi:hypothetical protein